jgi:hypothetical protein
MKRLALLLCVVMAALLAGCGLFPRVVGSGVMVTVNYDYADFSRLAATQACKVHIVPDTVYALTVTCDDNLRPYLDVRKNGTDSVSIGLDQRYNYWLVTFTAEVHMPVLASIDVSGASEARVDPGFASALPLELTLSGAGLVQLSGITCAGLSADLSGASSLSVKGSAGSETLEISGASTADLLDCVATQAHVSLSGASEAKLDVGAGDISLSASGASTLYYRGAPALHVLDLSGASHIVRVY